MKLDFDKYAERPEVFAGVQSFLDSKGFTVVATDHNRPWGGFFVLDESQAEDFIKSFFPHLSLEDFVGFEKLSPKVLVVAPDQRFSWQYDH